MAGSARPTRYRERVDSSNGLDAATILSIVAIAISGLTLLWTIGWSIYTHRRSTLARVAVTNSFSIPVYGDQLGEAAIDITATNAGSVTVTITGAQLRVRRRKGTLAPVEWVVQSPANLPTVLEPGKHWTGMVNARSIIQALDRQYGPRKKWTVKAFVRDPAGGTYPADKWVALNADAVAVFERR